LFFSANDLNHGTELWMYDGINDPILLYDINPGIKSSNPQKPTVYNNKLYFTTYIDSFGFELWNITFVMAY